MGHMLETVNPQAAADIKAQSAAAMPPPAPIAPEPPKPEPYRGRIPGVGETVLYHARPGEGRSGKVIFPAIVLHCNDRGEAQLVVMYAADDFTDRINIPPKSEDMPWPAWSLRGIPPDVKTLGVAMKQIAALSAEVDELKTKLTALDKRAAKAKADEG